MAGLPSLEPLFSQLRACTYLIRGSDYTKQNLDCLSRHLKCLFHIIISEKPPDVQSNNESFPESPDTTQAYQPLGPVLVAFTKSAFLQQLVAWVDPTRVPIDIRSFLLRLVFLHLDLLVSQAKQDVLNCPEVLRPILQLLVYTRNLKEVEFSQELSLLLKSLCVLLCRDPFVLKNSEKVSLECTREKYFIFSQLVPLLHLQSPAGDNVRDAFLLILALSVRDPDVAQYLTSGSDLCPVLATGLSGLYSSLPRNLIVNTESPRGDMSLSKELYVPGAGWHRLSKQEWSSCQPLSQFLNTLDFCDLAVRKSGVPVRKHILFYIYSGFLLPVLGSALHQDSVDEVVAATAYLELFLRRLTEPALIGVFLRFIITAEFDSSSVLSTLISRLNSNPTCPSDQTYQLTMVTLSLFRTVLSLNCEDAMYRLVFQYVNNVGFEYVQHSETISGVSGNATSSEDWFLSAARFLSLTTWYDPLDFASAGKSGFSKSKTRSSSAADAFADGAFFNTPLREAYSRIIGKATGTSCWTCDYSSRLTEPDSPKFPWVAANASDAAAPLPDGRLHLENSLFAPKPPVRRAVEDKILDKYNLGKSESSLYQLSYLDSSSEEDLAGSHLSSVTTATVTSRKPVSSDDTTEAFSSPDLSAGSLTSPSRTPHSLFSAQLAEVRTLLEEEDAISRGRGGLDHSPLVSDFIRILQKSQPAAATGASALPYPPVDPFFMQLLESQLTMETSCLTAVASSTVNEGDEQEGAMAEAPPVPFPDDAEEAAADKFEEQRGLLDLSLIPVDRNVGGGLGPFLNALLGRLDCMNRNCLYTNLLLTDVLLTLVSYPQSPLAELLLNNSVVQLKLPARSLFQVLSSVRKNLQEAAAKVENWKGLVEDARDYLRSSEEIASPVGQRSPRPRQSVGQGSAFADYVTEDDLLVISAPTNEKVPHPLGGPTSSVFGRPPTSPHPATMNQAKSPNMLPPAGRRWSRLLEPVVPPECNQPSPQPSVHKRRSSFSRLSHLLHAPHHANSPLSSPQAARRLASMGPVIGTETRNLVYAFIVLEEFCLELACICCEQGVFYGRALPKLERTLSLENCLANI
ncbi:hypothetical protein SprV_0100440400 [Sparganum proliferum]